MDRLDARQANSEIYADRTLPGKVEFVMTLQADIGARVSVIVNGEAIRTPARTLAELLDHSGHGEARVATALNGEFVSERRRGDVLLKDGDRVEIVSPRQGG